MLNVSLEKRMIKSRSTMISPVPTNKLKPNFCENSTQPSSRKKPKKSTQLEKS